MNKDTFEVIENTIYKKAEQSANEVHPQALDILLSSRWEGRYCEIDIAFFRKKIKAQPQKTTMELIRQGKIVADDVRTICVVVPDFQELFQQAPLPIKSWAELRAELSRILRDQLTDFFVEVHTQRLINSLQISAA